VQRKIESPQIQYKQVRTFISTMIDSTPTNAAPVASASASASASAFVPVTNATSRHNATSMDLLLENEKERNKTESWNKLEKADRVEKLRVFADNWTETDGDANAETKTRLFIFLRECLDKNKLKNKKDIVYDKESMTIKSIPLLVYADHVFSLISDSKRMSTLKSLTPRRKDE
jgi:hypothetical protein